MSYRSNWDKIFGKGKSSVEEYTVLRCTNRRGETFRVGDIVYGLHNRHRYKIRSFGQRKKQAIVARADNLTRGTDGWLIKLDDLTTRQPTWDEYANYRGETFAIGDVVYGTEGGGRYKITSFKDDKTAYVVHYHPDYRNSGRQRENYLSNLTKDKNNVRWWRYPWEKSEPTIKKSKPKSKTAISKKKVRKMTPDIEEYITNKFDALREDLADHLEALDKVFQSTILVLEEDLQDYMSEKLSQQKPKSDDNDDEECGIFVGGKRDKKLEAELDKP